MAYQRTSSIIASSSAAASEFNSLSGFTPRHQKDKDTAMHVSHSFSLLANDDEPDAVATVSGTPTHASAATGKTTTFKEKFVVVDPHQSGKQLVIFSVDISNCHPSVQFIILIGGLILFMCLYGYYQELVIYGWFERKLSIFSTFLHFLGCSIVAYAQRTLHPPAHLQQLPVHHGSSSVGGTQSFSNWWRGSHSRPSTTTLLSSLFSFTAWNHWIASWRVTMGTATPRLAFGYYLLLVLTKTAAQGLSNLSMSQINYPAKVLFKSANPIVTMAIGVLWFHRTYPRRDYLVVSLLVLGLYVYITSDSGQSPHATKLGIFYVILSMVGSAGVPMIQEYCLATYNAAVEDLIYFTFLGSAAISLLLSLLFGEFAEGIGFLISKSSLSTWVAFTAFCTFGFCGAHFSTAITAQYGSLVNGIANTFRKAVTLAVSFWMFPERNILSHQKMAGTAIFFAGLVVKMWPKSHSVSDGSRPISKSQSEPQFAHIVSDPADDILVGRDYTSSVSDHRFDPFPVHQPTESSSSMSSNQASATPVSVTVHHTQPRRHSGAGLSISTSLSSSALSTSPPPTSSGPSGALPTTFSSLLMPGASNSPGFAASSSR